MDTGQVTNVRDLIEVPFTTLFFVGHNNGKIGVYDYDTMTFVRYITNPVGGMSSFVSFLKSTRILITMNIYGD